MLFDLERVKENKIRARETRANNFVIKRVFSDFERRILELDIKWENGLIEGCREIDLKELKQNNNVLVSEFSNANSKDLSLDLYANLMQLHWSNDPYTDFSEKIKLLKPKGQFFCCLFGTQTLEELRDCFSKAEMKVLGKVSPRVSPLPEIRDVGNLATKVGLNNCVVDRDITRVDYKTVADLFIDIKEMGETSAILDRRKGLITKNLINEVEKLYIENFSKKDLGRKDNTIIATFEVIFLHGTK
tara:strand:- start:137 stop:871 length:735 start_codon:yes stop_codon:yes gene_type:complete